jgi:lipopolysaccharide biosynthesis glycosyltransferase
VEQHETCGHVTTPTLLKLSAVDKLFGSYDRVVYLDNDVVVFDDLKIEAIQFGSLPIAAVADMDLSDTGAFRDWARGYESGDADMSIDYFNAGVLFFEAKNWRSDEFLQKYSAALDQHDLACRYKIKCTSIDQCAVNTVFEKNWKKLPLSYNMQASAKFTPAWQTASVRHYCGTRKAIPVTRFRNDSRDVRYLNEIRRVLGRPGTRFPPLYEVMFRLNALRNYRGDLAIRRYMQAIHAECQWAQGST